MITNNVTQLIGNTPLIKLKYPSEISGCEIYGKAEFMNPAGSVKDRTALGIIEDAEEKNYWNQAELLLKVLLGTQE
jgi:cysteine synthase A